MADGCAWAHFDDHDALFDEPRGKEFPAATEDELAHCREICLELGYGGFVVRREKATFRPHGRREILERKSNQFWDRGAVLHVAPHLPQVAREGIEIAYGDSSRSAAPSTLAAKSGYFDSLFRHNWADGYSGHSFAEFPGRGSAFAFAMEWLAVEAGGAVGSPWPVRDVEDACGVIAAAAYLDAPGLLRASVRSWRLAPARGDEELRRVALAMIRASVQFTGETQGLIIEELRATLLEAPRHLLQLTAEFLVAPAAGIVVLEVKHAARSVKDHLIGHIRHFGDWVGSVAAGGERAEPEERLSPHEFAAQLYGAHEEFFSASPAMLQKLLRYLDPASAIAPPLCFRVAAAVAAATQGAPGGGLDLAAEIFARGVAAAEDPAQAASDDACVAKLFGAGGCGAATGGLPLGLDALARPLVPPAAAAVVLSRVLSSWGASESREGGADAADVILAGVASDRQRLRTLLLAVLPRITDEDAAGMGTEWGNSFDYAVPELCAAFVRAATKAMEAGEANPRDETLQLLFRVLFEPTGGLPGVRFPLGLLRAVRGHSNACAVLAAERTVKELRDTQVERPGRAWAAAEMLWATVNWDVVDASLLSAAVEMLRGWLLDLKASSVSHREKAEGKASAVRLMQQLPLQKLDAPEAALGPPFPAHVLLCLSRRELADQAARIGVLEAENASLRREISRLQKEK